MFDPVDLAKKTEKLVCKGDERKYYRFRSAKFYGGIATADCVGCNIRCAYCWAWNMVNSPAKSGGFYSSEEVSSKLVSIAKREGFRQVRISGNEPTIGNAHLLSVLEKIPKDMTFILETNGILIGHDKAYARELSKFDNLHVRVCLKGTNHKEFGRFTGADPDAFEYQLKALEELERNRVKYHPALGGADLIQAENIEWLKERLAQINPDLPDHLELEQVIRYPAVVKRLKKLTV